MLAVSSKRKQQHRAGSIVCSTCRSIAAYLRTFWQAQGYGPSVREVQLGCGLSSPSIVAYHVDVLRREGLVSRTGAARSLRLSEAGREWLGEEGGRGYTVRLAEAELLAAYAALKGASEGARQRAYQVLRAALRGG